MLFFKMKERGWLAGGPHLPVSTARLDPSPHTSRNLSEARLCPVANYGTQVKFLKEYVPSFLLQFSQYIE